ncbi:hypothetical protein HZ326_17686 [Fusarium oxysporum f. sp. albedinis]|nr:hypothetical protein HZ326_17686 [Fusarium oxysporum f. sp. albedinis]
MSLILGGAALPEDSLSERKKKRTRKKVRPGTTPASPFLSHPHPSHYGQDYVHHHLLAYTHRHSRQPLPSYCTYSLARSLARSLLLTLDLNTTTTTTITSFTTINGFTTSRHRTSTCIRPHPLSAQPYPARPLVSSAIHSTDRCQQPSGIGWVSFSLQAFPPGHSRGPRSRPYAHSVSMTSQPQ